MEQFDRTKRYLNRIARIYEGIFSSSGHDSEAYDDDVVSFFIHCYHVRDWVIQLNRADITARQVDSYIDGHRALRICADLANGSKHCKLTRSLRTGHQPHMIGKERNTSTWLAGRGGGEVMKSTYTIQTNTEFVDAFDLATECVQLWETFLHELQGHNSCPDTDASHQRVPK